MPSSRAASKDTASAPSLSSERDASAPRCASISSPHPLQAGLSSCASPHEFCSMACFEPGQLLLCNLSVACVTPTYCKCGMPKPILCARASGSAEAAPQQGWASTVHDCLLLWHAVVPLCTNFLHSYCQAWQLAVLLRCICVLVQERASICAERLPRLQAARGRLPEDLPHPQQNSPQCLLRICFETKSAGFPLLTPCPEE